MEYRLSKSWRDADKVAKVYDRYGKTTAGSFLERVISLRKIGMWEAIVLTEQCDILIAERHINDAGEENSAWLRELKAKIV